MIHKLLIYSIITLVCITILGASFVGFMYWYGLRALPQDTSPSTIIYPPVVLETTWISFGGIGPLQMTRLSPWNWIMTLSERDPRAGFPESILLSSFASRKLLNRKPYSNKTDPPWQLSYISATIWVSRHWTADQAVSTILSESYFGHGFHGFNQASLGYFGKQSVGLSVTSVAVIIALLKSPTMYDPWCSRDRSQSEARSLIEQMQKRSNVVLEKNDSYLLDGLLSPPMDVCEETKI